jgi:group I intron endonuclease
VIGIYKITNKINGKIYIGQSFNIAGRFREYNRPKFLFRESLIAQALKKYGKENFTFEIEEKIDIEKLPFINSSNVEFLSILLGALEKFYIKKYDSIKLGYNTSKGGTANWYKRKLGKINKCEKEKTEFKFHNYEHKKIICLDNKEVFASSTELRKKLKFSNSQMSTLRRCLSGQVKTYKGKHYLYYNDYIQKIDDGYDFSNLLASEGRRKKVICLETKKVFNSSWEASDYIGVPKGRVSANIIRKTKTKGYTFMYYTDYIKFGSVVFSQEKQPMQPIPIRCIETGETFSSIREASKKTNIEYNTIRHRLKNNVKSNISFEYINNEDK